jgi:hypothetical protein
MTTTDKRQFPFYANEAKGRDAWCRAAYGYWLDLVAQGKDHHRAVKLAIAEADADLLPQI